MGFSSSHFRLRRFKEKDIVDHRVAMCVWKWYVIGPMTESCQISHVKSLVSLFCAQFLLL